MKFHNFKSLALIFAIFIGVMSCQKSLDINTDPNNASTATPKLVLPTAQFVLGTVVGGTWGFVGSMWAQYWTGGFGVSTSQLEYYNMLSSDVNPVWTRAYARSLNDMQFLVKSDKPVYAGIAKIMQAYTFQMLCDLHGAIPMSEALKGAIDDGGIVTPKYDTEEQVYDALIPLVQAGLDDIALGGDAPSTEDLIYGGDLDNWKKFANTLKLKILVRSGKYAEAKTFMTSGVDFISDATDECKLQYFETGQNTNPIYAQFTARIGIGMYYVATKSSVDKLVALGDPRFTSIYTAGTGNGGEEGVSSGDINDNTTLYPSGGVNTRFCSPSPKVFGATVPVFFISSWESKFLQSEVMVRNGDDGSTLFEEAIQASCDYYGVAVGSYATNLTFSAFPADGQLDLIAVQKWIAMNGLQMAEGWLETLRFDRTGHNIFKNGIFTSPINNSLGVNGFPSSFIYPTQEVSNNSANVPAGRSVNSRRFWDAN